MFMTGKVRVVLKSNEIIEGDVMPHEDVEGLKDHIPLFSLFGHDQFKEGIFLFTGHKIMYLDRNEIKTMTCLKFV